MKTKVKHYRLQVTMSLEEFTQFGDAVKAQLASPYSYALCGDTIRISKIWINKSNFDVFHPTFSDMTECLGVTSDYMYYMVPSTKLTHGWKTGVFAKEDSEFVGILYTHLYKDL